MLTGGAELGSDLVLLVVQVFVGFDLASQFLVDQDALANNDIGLGKAYLHVAFLGQGHATHDHVKLLGDQGRDDAVPCSADQFKLNAHSFCDTLRHVDVEADDLTFFVGHFERHVARLHADTQGATLKDVVEGVGNCNTGQDYTKSQQAGNQ